MNKIKHTIHWLLIFLLPLKAISQFSDSTKNFTSYAATGIINKTQESNSFLLSNILKYQYKSKKITLNNSNSFVYGEQQKRITNRDISTSADFNYRSVIPHFYYWGLVNFDKSYSLKINNRLQTGVGVAYNFFDKPDFTINVSDGFIYEYSNLQLTDSTTDKYNTVRNSLRVRYRMVIKEIIILNGTNFYQPSLLDGNDYIIQLSNNVSVRLRKWLSFTAAATYNKVQRTHRENLLLTFGLTAEKYF